MMSEKVLKAGLAEEKVAKRLGGAGEGREDKGEEGEKLGEHV